MDMLQKISPIEIIGENVENVPCPGGQEACPDQTTCCQMASGQYACCPAPKVCLIISFQNIKLLQKISAIGLVKEKVEKVPCPGGQVECPDQTTCCQMASGQYACCPAPKVCLIISFSNMRSPILIQTLCTIISLKYPYFAHLGCNMTAPLGGQLGGELH